MIDAHDQELLTIGKFVNNEISLDYILDLFRGLNREQYTDTFLLIFTYWLINSYIKSTGRLLGIAYAPYLNTKEWKAKRKIIIRLYKRCQLYAKAMLTWVNKV